MRAECQISSSVVNGVRRLLIDEGRWQEIERALLERDPDMEDWLEDTGRRPYVSFAGHRRLLEAVGGDEGAPALRRLGHARLSAAMDLGPVAPILRCWVRQYAHIPTALLHVAPYVWDVILHHAGRLQIEETGPHRMVYRAVDAPEALHSATLWHALVEGYGTELLRRSGRDGEVRVQVDARGFALVGTWDR